jgi:hypothetical protein
LSSHTEKNLHKGNEIHRYGDSIDYKKLYNILNDNYVINDKYFNSNYLKEFLSQTNNEYAVSEEIKENNFLNIKAIFNKYNINLNDLLKNNKKFNPDYEKSFYKINILLLLTKFIDAQDKDFKETFISIQLLDNCVYKINNTLEVNCLDGFIENIIKNIKLPIETYMEKYNEKSIEDNEKSIEDNEKSIMIVDGIKYIKTKNKKLINNNKNIEENKTLIEKFDKTKYNLFKSIYECFNEDPAEIFSEWRDNKQNIQTITNYKKSCEKYEEKEFNECYLNGFYAYQKERIENQYKSISTIFFWSKFLNIYIYIEEKIKPQLLLSDATKLYLSDYMNGGKRKMRRTRKNKK